MSAHCKGAGRVNPLFDPASPEYNHVMQILNACKCLFVSHRKIAIYLQSLNAEKTKDKQSQQQQQSVPSGVLNESTNLVGNEACLKQSDEMTDTDTTVKTCKLTLSDIRIPLSWKYSDHLKAAKNSGSFIFLCLKNV